MTRGMYHHRGTWIVFMPLVGDFVELVERVTDPILGTIWARRRNRRMICG